MTLRELRKQKKLTQVECAKYLGIPVRTYQNCETDESKSSKMKYVCVTFWSVEYFEHVHAC